MSTSSINAISGSLVRNLLSLAPPGNFPISVSAPSPVQQEDSSRLSPFAQLLSQLEKLQQTDPAKFQAVTEKVAGALRMAAKAAEKDSNAVLSKQLEELFQQFAKVVKAGRLADDQKMNPLEVLARTLANSGVAIAL